MHGHSPGCTQGVAPPRSECGAPRLPSGGTEVGRQAASCLCRAPLSTGLGHGVGEGTGDGRPRNPLQLPGTPFPAIPTHTASQGSLAIDLCLLTQLWPQLSILVVGRLFTCHPHSCHSLKRVAMDTCVLPRYPTVALPKSPPSSLSHPLEILLSPACFHGSGPDLTPEPQVSLRSSARPPTWQV